jgi:hypothetical protein
MTLFLVVANKYNRKGERTLYNTVTFKYGTSADEVDAFARIVSKMDEWDEAKVYSVADDSWTVYQNGRIIA